MSPQQLAKLWTVVGTALVYYSLNAWLASQGGTEVFDVKLILSSRVPSAMIAIVVCSILLIVASSVGSLYARRGGAHWHARIPVVGFASIHTNSREGQTYQAAMLVLFSVLPALSLIHFWAVLSGGVVVTTGPAARLASGLWDLSALSGLNDPTRICSHLRDARLECEDGATFLPVIEPLLLAVASGLAAISAVRHWWHVFR